MASDTFEPILRERLANAGIPIHLWGQGTAKTVGHLLQEIRSGESIVSFSPTGDEVTRQVGVAWADVLYFGDVGRVFELHEARQVYTDGRIRQRTLASSLGEKLQAGEDPEAAVLRALHEELGINEPETLHYVDSDTIRLPTESYPGLPSNYTTYSFVTTLGRCAFEPDGYVEFQADKTNYYEWRQVR